jgi:hypothetical protein
MTESTRIQRTADFSEIQTKLNTKISIRPASPNTYRSRVAEILLIFLFVLFIPVAAVSSTLSQGTSSSARPSTKPDKLTGIYFPAASLYGRSLEGIVHYMKAADLNLAVLHAKDPMGRLFWKSENSMAKKIGASAPNASLETAIPFLKQKGLWTAAKLDVFQDSLLVTNIPEMGVMDSESGELWADRKGLHWANPYDRRVWDYTIALCQELIELGVDEIQFDYVRFPSDGNLSTIEYPVVIDGTTKADCIGKFLAYANAKLKPSGVLISVDLFGMTAWKTDDFGVGQVLEQIAPHVDVICPMLYPSHFPENFLNLENPGQYPYEILKSSLEEMKKRTGKEIRPWIQGFWYTPEEIVAQLQGVFDNRIQDWTVWNPTGRYSETFEALANMAGNSLPEPIFYPPLEDLRNQDDRILAGQTKIINQTSYREGFSILSLDDSADGEENDYDTITDVASTLDEGIIDRILNGRAFSFSLWTGRRTKITHITQLIIQDLSVDPYRMQPAPIYIDWENGCVFTWSVPPGRLDLYQNHIENMPTLKLKRQGGKRTETKQESRK